MKNAINYYYNLFPKDISQNKDEYYFFVDNIRYSLIKYEDDPKNVKNIYDMHIDILKKGMYVHPIILNKDGQILTIINNNNYILLQTIYYDFKITINDIMSFSNIILEDDHGLNRNNWGDLWSQKNDHLEYQISMLGIKHPIIRDSFSYFIGLGETAIQLVNSIEKTKAIKVCSHKRIRNQTKALELYNPLNLIADIQVRDIAEYFKHSFFKGENIQEELTLYLNTAKLSSYEYLMFLARMIYPTYYFDIYEEIIAEKKADEELSEIINKTSAYEQIIKSIYHYYKSFLVVPQIEWLE